MARSTAAAEIIDGMCGPVARSLPNWAVRCLAGGRVMRGGKPACATRLCWGELQIFMPAVHSPVTQTNKEQRIVGRI